MRSDMRSAVPEYMFDAVPDLVRSLREFAAANLGVTLGREQVRELVAWLDALRDEAESLWNSAVELSERE